MAVTGAAVVPVALVEQLQTELGFELVLTAFGMTEAVVVTMCRRGDPPELVARTCGRATAGFETRIGEHDEVLLRGPNVMLGYLDDADATAAAVDDAGWLHTGDVGALDEAGYLRITDRLKDMYISGGFNVYPAEVEQTLARLPGVADAAVVGVPDDRLGEVGVALVVRSPGSALDAEAVLAHCRERLANFKVPRTVSFRDSAAAQPVRQGAQDRTAQGALMTDEAVRYEVRGSTAFVTMNRPEYSNAQNSVMTYALDRAFQQAVDDDAVKVIVLAGAGKHFSAGHDIGTPGRDIDVHYENTAVIWWDHVGREGGDLRYAREMEVYLGMCRRWRDIPKPVIGSIHGACIAGGLMLAFVCDLIVASDDAFFADPVVRMGIPGVEYFAHPWVLGSRAAKEILFTGDRFSAQRAYEWGMVNRVVPRGELEAETLALAERIGAMPQFGLALTKRAVNQCEDAMGMRTGMDSVFGLHHFAHAHNAEVGTDSLGGMDPKSMKSSAT